MKKNYYLIFLILLTACTTGKHKPVFERFSDPETKLYGIKKDGKSFIPAKYEYLPDPFIEDGESSELTVVGDYYRGYERVNKKGETVFKTVHFDNGPDYYSNGLARFIENDKVGFHNRQAEVVVEAKYDYATPFNERGYSIVCRGCYLAPIPCKRVPLSNTSRQPYKDAPTCSHHANNPVGGLWGVIDKKGREVVPVKYPESDAKIKHYAARPAVR